MGTVNAIQPKTCRWQSYEDLDAERDGDVGSAPATDLEAVKRYVEQKGYSGFSVVSGVAYLKHFHRELSAADLVKSVGYRSVFHLCSADSEAALAKRWVTYEDSDLVGVGDVEMMDAANIDAVKRRAEQEGYSGFSVVFGTAYLKSLDRELTEKDLQRPSGYSSTFYMRLTNNLAAGPVKHGKHLQARPAKRWSVYEDLDLIGDGGVEATMDASDIDVVKSHVQDMGYSGFAVVRGTAYLKRFDRELIGEDLMPVQ